MSEVLHPDFDWERAVAITIEQGYFFAPDALHEEMRRRLEAEANGLDLADDTHVKNPINQGRPNEVRQRLEKLVVSNGDERVPVANELAAGLVDATQGLLGQFPELARWQPDETSYQRYRANRGFVGPHRDSDTDHLISPTFTVAGQASAFAYDPNPGTNGVNYANITLRERFETAPGSVMVLRARGLGDSQRTIHKVDQPRLGDRIVLNLRMKQEPGE